MKRLGSLPPVVGRADLVRAGLDLEGSDKSRARWFGFDYEAPVEAETYSIRLQPHMQIEGVDVSLKMVERPKQSERPIYCKRLSLNEPPKEAEAPPAQLANVVWGNRPKTPPKFYPLASGVRIKHLIELVLKGGQRQGKADVAAVIRQIARARPLEVVPRQEVSVQAACLQIVVDRSAHLTPIWADQSLVLSQIKRLFPELEVKVWVFEEARQRLRPLERGQAEAPDVEQGPLLALGDLGVLGPAGAEGWWRDLGRSFVFGGGVAHALCPGVDVGVARQLIGPWEILDWEHEAHVAGGTGQVNRLLTVLAPAIRLEPGLLRGVRRTLGQGASIADEIALWQDEALASRSAEAASFDPELKRDYQRKLLILAAEEPAAVRAALVEIRNWRQGGADEIWYEEVLSLPALLREDARFVDQTDIAAADAFFANMHLTSAQEALSSGQAAWLSRVGRRHEGERDGIWSHPHAGAAMLKVLKSDPSFVPPVIVEAQGQGAEWHANVALDEKGQLWFSGNKLDGQHLGTIAMGNGGVELVDPLTGERVAHYPLEPVGAVSASEIPQAPFLVQSGRGRLEIAPVEPEDVSWARAFGRDQYGLYAALAIADHAIRFRWIPPGHGFVGPTSDEPLNNSAPERQEIVFGTGFWLMERPVIRDDFFALGIGLAQTRFDLAPAWDQPYDMFEALASKLGGFADGAEVRLPTTWEWEYACRAGVDHERTYGGSPDLLDENDRTLEEIAWFAPSKLQMERNHSPLKAPYGPQSVAKKRPNAWGLYDMLGNVLEWCEADRGSAASAPLKGGHWQSDPEDIRCAFEVREDMNLASNQVGARFAIGRGEVAFQRVIPRPRPTGSPLRRNRPPRVQISYWDVYDTEKQLELPFVIGVMADLSGTSNDSAPLPPLSERRFRQVDKSSFGAFIEASGVQVFGLAETRPVRLPGNLFQDKEAQPHSGTLPGGSEGTLFSFNIPIRSMEDFSPGRIVEHVPHLKARMRQRRRLAELAEYFYDAPYAAHRLDDLLKDEKWVASAAELMRFVEGAQNDGAIADDDKAAVKALFSEGMDPKPFTEDVEALYAANFAMVLEESEYMPGGGGVLEAAQGFVGSFDHYLSLQVSAIMQTDEFRRLESAWRGLQYLVTSVETDQNLKIKVLNVSKSELGDSFVGTQADAWLHSPLFKQVYEAEFGTLGGEPYGALIGDYEFDHSRDDTNLLTNLSRICADALVPFISSASPRLFGLEDWAELGTIGDPQKPFEGPDYNEWRSLRQSEDANHLALTLPRVLAREPYGPSTVPVEEFDFREDVSTGENAPCWMSSAYPMGANIGRAFKMYGWTSRIRGIEAGGAVEGLPLMAVEDATTSMVARASTSAIVTDRMENALAQEGLISLLARPNTDMAAFMGVNSIAFVPRTRSVLPGEAAAARLPVMMPVWRFGQYVKCMLRDRIGMSMSEDDMAQHVQKWLDQYVTLDAENASDLERARRPLASAKVEVSGGVIVLSLTPHLPLERLDVPVTLRIRLPQERFLL